MTLLGYFPPKRFSYREKPYTRSWKVMMGILRCPESLTCNPAQISDHRKQGRPERACSKILEQLGEL